MPKLDLSYIKDILLTVESLDYGETLEFWKFTERKIDVRGGYLPPDKAPDQLREHSTEKIKYHLDYLMEYHLQSGNGHSYEKK